MALSHPPSDPTPPQNPPPPPDQDPPEGADPDFKAWSQDPTNARYVRQLRNQNAAYRIRARNAEQRLTSLDPDGSNTVNLSAKDTELRATKVENGLLRVTRSLGVDDVDLLHAYLQTTGAMKDLDPSEPSFVDDLTARVEEVLERKPALRGGSPSNVPATTGAQFNGSAPTGQFSRADLSRMSPEEINDARQRGLLDRVLGRS